MVSLNDTQSMPVATKRRLIVLTGPTAAGKGTVEGVLRENILIFGFLFLRLPENLVMMSLMEFIIGSLMKKSLSAGRGTESFWRLLLFMEWHIMAL